MEISYRKGSAADSYQLFEIFARTEAARSQQDVEHSIASWWPQRRALFKHLASNAFACWIAHDGGRPVGYARSALRGNMLQLTDFYVLPECQGAGIGAELLIHVFPEQPEGNRLILSPNHVRAVVRYLKSGVVVRSALGRFEGRLGAEVQYELEFKGLDDVSSQLDVLARVDMRVLGFRRDVDHTWLAQERRGLLYYDQGQLAGYGYIGAADGPFAVLDPRHFPEVLAHAAAMKRDEDTALSLWVPLVNRAAVSWLLDHGYQMNPDVNLIMSDLPFGSLSGYIASESAQLL